MLPSAKRRRLPPAAGVEERTQPLLPGLPDDVAQLCLARLPPTLLFTVCRGWRRLLYSPSFPPFLSLYALLGPAYDADASDDPVGVAFHCYDPIAGSWGPLPPHPPLPVLLLRHPSFIARALPVQSVAAGDHLVLLAATTHRLLPALPRPLAFHPPSRRWRLGPELRHPRRWCAAGAAAGQVYLASGIGSEYSAEVARSAERWDPRRCGGGWEPVAALRDGRFSREAVEAVAARGQLYVVSVRGRGAKEGAVYRLGSGRWEEMRPGMRSGWSGPAASSEAGEAMYVVDEEEGILKEYVWERDAWRVVMEWEGLRGAAQMAAGGGRVCVACGGGARIVVVDVASSSSSRRRMWVVEPPAGKRVIAVHVLPRMPNPSPQS